ncbi:MAG TPA: hypothetical protein VEO37_11845 [Thermoanaerobaculia bacterium]|nr:hypothetical protein [Thermoanaerobaculia bacterium]
MLRSISMAGALALTGFLLIPPGAGSATLPSRKDTWLRVETAHFTLYGDARESKIKEVGEELEKLRSVLLVLRQSLTASSPVPTSVFVFKSDAALDSYKPLFRGRPSRASGFFQSSREGNFIAMAAGWNTDPRPIIFHEYLHDFLHSNFPPQPTWYEEGVADFYSTFFASKTEAHIGLPVESHVLRLRGQALLPLEKLFAIRHDSPEYNEESRQHLFYAQSWALVHYLMGGEPRRSAQLGRFLVLLQQGRKQEEAFREAFQTDYDGLLRELSRYVRGGRFHYSRIRFSELKLPTEVRTERIEYEEALFHLGDLLAHSSPDRMGDAGTHFQAILSAVPSNGAALTGMGLLRLRQERFPEADELFQRAIAAGSRDFRAHFHHGELAMHSLSGQLFVPGHPDAKQRAVIEEARASFRRSIDCNPDFAEAHAALGRTYLFEEGEAASEGIAKLETAVARLASRKDLALELAELYDRRGDRGKADDLLRRVLGSDAAAQLAEWHKKDQFREALDRVNAFLANQKDDEALALLEELVATAPADIGAILREQASTLKQGAAKNRAIREYNAAVARYNTRDLEEALAGFEKVAATAEDEELARSARQQADWVAHLLKQKRPKKKSVVSSR